ncbi:MAG: VOC family protein [Thermoplasmatota archaeon]
MARPKSSLNWFEIPVIDFRRGVDFYNRILDCKMYESVVMGNEMAFFPMEDPGIGGALIKSDDQKPSMDGTMVYLNGGEDLITILDRVEDAGGKVLIPKTKISDEIGHFAVFKDTEGNRVALHSMK